MNDQIKYYGEMNISPEHQNIDDIEQHYERRAKLYRQCGIPEIVFRDAEMLEVGPGSGYNTLAYFHWKCKQVDLVETNPQGIKDMKQLFAEWEIPNDKYRIFEGIIEDYCVYRKYDIVVAEGFIPTVDNKEKIIDKLISLTNEKGIIVITCVDKVGFFIEAIKRLVGVSLSQNISTYEEKVRYLTDIFEPQLAQLRGMSKLPEDWIKDVILSPVINNGQELSLGQAIRYFQDDFDILGTSPGMFTDYSWSKDIWYDYKSDYLEQFDQKRLSLLMAGMAEVILPFDIASFLVKGFEDIKDIEVKYEENPQVKDIQAILDRMKSMEKYIKQYFQDDFVNVFYEIENILSRIEKGEKINMEKYPNFFKAFGRTQQYISFVKK